MISEPLFQTTRQLAVELADCLERRDKTIVFAESCTGGLVAAILAQVPGISRRLYGSMVTYQESAKTDWLHVEPSLVRDHTAVSAEVTREMAKSVLRLSPSTDVSVAITGHLELQAAAHGPHAVVAIACRRDDVLHLTRPARYPLPGLSRIDRQWEAARAALNVAVEHLSFTPVAD